MSDSTPSSLSASTARDAADPADPADTASAISPTLFYRDAPAMIAWLERAFGFRSRLIVPGDNGTIRHSELSLGSVVIMVCSSRPDRGWKSVAELGGASAGVCVAVSDPDAHHARAVAAGAEVIFPLQETHYGSRDYTARDPEGTSWTFGTYVPGAYWDGATGS
ncbi:MAG: VOC family protein [Gemmatimonadota bacterium]